MFRMIDIRRLLNGKVKDEKNNIYIVVISYVIINILEIM